jgi:succinate dehydrogenase/fumarate reductase cytochrome b subunit
MMSENGIEIRAVRAARLSKETVIRAVATFLCLHPLLRRMMNNNKADATSDTITYIAIPQVPKLIMWGIRLPALYEMLAA